MFFFFFFFFLEEDYFYEQKSIKVLIIHQSNISSDAIHTSNLLCFILYLFNLLRGQSLLTWNTMYVGKPPLLFCCENERYQKGIISVLL